MRSDARRWIGATAGVWALSGILMVLLGMEPRILLVGLIVAAVSATGWLLGDLFESATPVSWHNFDLATGNRARPDHRVQVLTSRLRRTARRRSTSSNGAERADRADPDDEISDTLLAVVEDHLLAELGIDRTADADRAARALGADLTRFVTDPVVRRSMTRRRTLPHTITLVEDFTASTGHT